MVFRLVDVKKTVRSRSDGERYLHPKLLEGTAAGAQIDLALGYLHSRLGRARREVDPEILVRFFGDATLARGLVACLSATYRWQTQSLADVLDAKDVARLATRGIHTASDLRLFLYDALNAHGDGFLGAEREEQLQPLAHRLHLAPAKLDQLVALDADENAVLVRVGTAPDPDQVLRLYNYSVVDAIVRNSQYITLHGIDDATSEQLAAACRTYDVEMDRQGDGVRLRNRADAFGSFARWGLRLARALYSAAAARPSLLASGKAHRRSWRRACRPRSAQQCFTTSGRR